MPIIPVSQTIPWHADRACVSPGARLRTTETRPRFAAVHAAASLSGTSIPRCVSKSSARSSRRPVETTRCDGLINEYKHAA